MSLRLCQFNVLAPSARVCAPLDRIPWYQRHASICDAITAAAPQLVCIQEFCFSTPGFSQVINDVPCAHRAAHANVRVKRECLL